MNFREARLYADLFTSAVAISIGIALASLTWHIAGDPGRLTGDNVPSKPRRARAVDINQLIALAPFGTSQPISQGPSDTTVQLRGIMLAQPRSASAALVSVGGAAPVPFYIGQQLGGGTIEVIEMERVLVKTGNGIVELTSRMPQVSHLRALLAAEHPRRRRSSDPRDDTFGFARCTGLHAVNSRSCGLA